MTDGEQGEMSTDSRESAAEASETMPEGEAAKAEASISQEETVSGAIVGSVRAERVSLSHSAAIMVGAGRDIAASQSGALAFVAGRDISGARGGGVLIAGNTMKIERGGGGVMIAGRARVSDSIIGLLVSSKTRLQDGARVLLTGPQAIALGAAFGVALVLGLRWAKRTGTATTNDV